ncbi:MAG: hypothetical protein P4L67_00585 [Candidatus Pacebacteria bacterium]|nr:hypothetical protein [Candidatus Paceibacterota bacterium]
MQEGKALPLYKEEAELPVLRLLDRKLMENPQYRQAARVGYLGLDFQPDCIECSYYEKGIMAGIALWDVCRNIKHHDRAFLNKVLESPESEMLAQIRRHVARFCEIPSPEPDDIVFVPLIEARRVPSSFSASLPFIMVGESRGFA